MEEKGQCPVMGEFIECVCKCVHVYVYKRRRRRRRRFSFVPFSIKTCCWRGELSSVFQPPLRLTLAEHVKLNCSGNIGKRNRNNKNPFFECKTKRTGKTLINYVKDKKRFSCFSSPACVYKISIKIYGIFPTFSLFTFCFLFLQNCLDDFYLLFFA